MRKLVYRAIVESTALLGEIPAARWVSGGSMDTTPDLPFAVVRFTGDDPSPSRNPMSRVEFWIHDTKGSYTRIDRILGLIKTRFDGQGFKWSDLPGQFISQAEWQSTSGDLIDGGYNTNTRMASYQLVGRST